MLRVLQSRDLRLTGLTRKLTHHVLPQAGILANQLLEKHLANKGYYQCQHTPGLWRQVWQSITFCLVVDDFWHQGHQHHDMDHLINALKEHYTIAIGMRGSLFCGIRLTWNYLQRHVDCYIPRYINKALMKYYHPKPVSPQHAPYRVAPIQYGDGCRGCRLIPHNPSPQSRSNASKTSLVPSCTMCEQLTRHFLLHSAPL